MVTVRKGWAELMEAVRLTFARLTAYLLWKSGVRHAAEVGVGIGEGLVRPERRRLALQVGLGERGGHTRARAILVLLDLAILEAKRVGGGLAEARLCTLAACRLGECAASLLGRVGVEVDDAGGRVEVVTEAPVCNGAQR